MTTGDPTRPRPGTTPDSVARARTGVDAPVWQGAWLAGRIPSYYSVPVAVFLV
ncbi:MAG: hypothetical protein ACTSU5_02800 [Promethearchaeota archaeon]